VLYVTHTASSVGTRGVVTGYDYVTHTASSVGMRGVVTGCDYVTHTPSSVGMHGVVTGCDVIAVTSDIWAYTPHLILYTKLWLVTAYGQVTAPHIVQIGSGVHTASYPLGTERPFSGGKAIGPWSLSLTN
jgi:hypothetical protein